MQQCSHSRGLASIQALPCMSWANFSCRTPFVHFSYKELVQNLSRQNKPKKNLLAQFVLPPSEQRTPQEADGSPIDRAKSYANLAGFM